MLDQLKQWDRELFVYLNSLGLEQYDQFWILVTRIENWIPFYIFLFMLFFLAFDWKKAAFTSIFLLATFLSTWGFTNLVKNIYVRLRPNNNPDLVDLIRILQEPTNYSFFSGHASASVVVATFVVLVLKDTYRWIYAVFIWPLLFILSRVYVGVHYPSDLLVGAIVGVAFAYLFFWLYNRSGRRFI